MKTGAVVVAAGMSSRMGDFKPMLKIGSISMAERIVANFQQADVFPIVVVTGYRAAELERHIAKMGVICVRNTEYEHTQMFDSAKLGLSFIRDKCDRTFFTPVDIPLFTYDTVIKMMQSNSMVVKPVCADTEGHPILINCSLIGSILETGGKEGLKKALAECCGDVELIAVDDEGVLCDADTPSDFARIADMHTRQLFRPVVDVSLMREGKLFDKNGAMLLHMIEYSGTVKDACEKVGMSYSRAWNLLSQLEENLGFALLERQPGGEYGGTSRLTDEGVKLLRQYEKYVEEIKRYSNSIFRDYFEG